MLKACAKAIFCDSGHIAKAPMDSLPLYGFESEF
jgi:hypothetical protein